MKKLLLSMIIFVFSTSLIFSESRLMRYPAVSKTQIAFSLGGDIYSVPISGGNATRLTSSEGLEIFPKFSPDGKKIAFPGEYDGNRDIYIIPAEGGPAFRVTYDMDIGPVPERMGPDKIVMQWTKDNKLLFRSRSESWNPFVGKLYFIDPEGGLPEELPLTRGGFATLSPDENKLTFNRIFREFRTWKRYKGGMADDIRIYDFKTKKTENITNNNFQDIIPMWHGDKIYYLSDRTKRMNIYSYDIKTKQTKQITDYKDFDIKFPSMGPDYIVFEKGGYLYLMDFATESIKKVVINVNGDFPDARPRIVGVQDKITSFEIAPDGNRALFTARGDIFTVPAQKGNIRNLTSSCGAHDRNAVWSPDGKWIAFISDKSGEDEIYLMKPDGSDLIRITNDAESYRYGLRWSPDSKKILSSDKALKLYYIDIESKKTTYIEDSQRWEIRDFSWSPDSKWISFTDFTDAGSNVVKLYSLENKDIHIVTDKFFASESAVFSPDGKYIYFVSNRTFRPRMGHFEQSYTYNEMSKIYGLTLQKGIESPFKFESDEVEIKDDANKKEKKGKKKKDEELKVTIDFDGIENRIFELPIHAANYYNLTPVENKLYFVHNKPGSKPELKVFDFDAREESSVADFGAYEISSDGKMILFRHGKDYYIEKLGAKVKPKDGKLNLADMKVTLDPREEWMQIFNEAWRQMKYFFYDPNMHGVDWQAVHDQYEALVPYVTHRDELTFIIGEMIGELNCGHSYVGGGEMEKVPTVGIGLLGAKFKTDKSGFYQITKIYDGRNWDEDTRSPLTEPGIDVKTGDYIISIDGHKLSKTYHPYKALVDKVGKYVTLMVNSKPSATGAHEITVKTIKSEKGLVYLDWVESNRRKVDEMTDGKIGYIHIPNMMIDGLNEFVKYFYPQIRKEGLIIDDRFNGGGFVSRMIIERLRRVLTMAGNARNSKMVTTYPAAVFTGPMVCLLNELSASDGDLFPYNFKQNHLGKLIGRRSWGGVIGIRGSLPLLDGSYLYKPEFANFSADGKWVLEGVGMSPDIDVENDPALEYEGTDQQLNRAVEEILKEIENYKGPKIPKVPEHPFKN